MLFTGTNQITLASFNKANMPIFGHTCFGHFWANCAENFWWELRRLLSTEYRLVPLVKIIPTSDAYVSFLIFWATFGRKMGVATTSAPNGLGHPNPIKKLTDVMDLFGQPLSRNHVFTIFGKKVKFFTISCLVMVTDAIFQQLQCCYHFVFIKT